MNWDSSSAIVHITREPLQQLNFKPIVNHRYHVAMRLFSNRSEITSKCGKSKEVVHKTIEGLLDEDTTILENLVTKVGI